jgi:oligopeptide transport system permease protein
MATIGSAAHPLTITTPSVRRGPWLDAARRLRANRLALASGAFIVLVLTIAVFAGVISPYDPTYQDLGIVFDPPGPNHPLGTDNLGRDTLSRLIYGARTSLTVGLFAQVILLLIGIPYGAMAGFFGGRVDSILMRLVDLVYAFPDLLLIILLRSIFGGSIYMMFIAIGLAEWTGLARLTRGQVLTLRQQEYVTAARAIGASWPHLLFRHMLPNAISPIIVALVFGIPRAIFAEAALSYIGVGVQPPTPSWGTMVNEGYAAIFAFPHLILAPAFAIASLTLAFAFLGDGLRDALDPRGSR